MKTLLLSMMILLLSGPAQADALSLLAGGGKGGWLNTPQPVTRDDLADRIVLLDFWTYGCINCMHVIPDLEYLESRFGNDLLVIGVHSAKFDGERDNARILAAAKRFGLEHPVINDSDYAIWNAFAIKAWPTLVLLGRDGREIARFRGEGHRDAIESAISTALGKAPSVTQKPANDIHTAPARTSLSFPARLATNAHDFYIADTGHHRITGFSGGGIVTRTFGSGLRGFSDGPADTAQFNNPRGIALDGDNLYVADTGNHAIRRIDLSSGQVTTLAGNGKKGVLASPWDIEKTGDDLFSIAMAGNHKIFTLNVVTGELSPIAGSGHEDMKDGNSAAASLAQPSGLSWNDGILFFVDAESSALRMLHDGNVKTLVGAGLFDFNFIDGPARQARLQHPQGIFAIRSSVYVADTYNNAIRLYNRDTDTVSTIKIPAGTLNEPGDVIAAGNFLYVADTNNHRIVVIDPADASLRELTLRMP